MIAVNRLLDMLYPPKCVLCGCLLDRGVRYICAACLDKEPISKETIQPDGLYFNRVMAPFFYDGAVSRAMKRYKFSSSPQLAEAFAYFMWQVLAAQAIEFDAMTWVPSKNTLSGKRGYQQTRLLAEKLSGHARGGLPKPEELLVKCRETAPQYTLDRRAREDNVRDAFAVHLRADVEDKRILLVDDTLTTGATVSECARVLLKAGARVVTVATFARTPGDKSRKSCEKARFGKND